jgi:glycosyltransferase involved in cell wall biosynthesis
MPMGEWGDQYFEQYGVPRSRMYHMPYTPDYEYFARVESQRLHQFRQRQGLSTARRHLLFCGRLVPMKRVDLLIDAFAAVADERPLWDLLIIGDGVLAGELKQRVPERLRPRVKWIGFLESDELVPAYHAADVLVLPSDREPWAVVVQEAMSAGLAVVASDVVGAARELIEDGVSGRIFSAGDVESLGRALRDVTDEQKLPAYKQRSQAGLASWRRAIDPVAEIRRALADAGVLPLAARPAATSPARQEQSASI